MEVNGGKRKLYLGFVGLALLAGPIDQSVSSAFLIGSPLPRFHSLALAFLFAGFVLAIVAVLRRERIPNRAEWTALLVLVLPQWLFVPIGPSTASLPALHLSWGTALLLSLAAPLWLGLLSATNLTEVEVPRSTIAAAIIGIGAICLMLPLDAIAVGWRQLAALLLNALLGVAIVASWTFARPRLRECPLVSTSVAYLALSFVGYIAFAGIFERDAWRGLYFRLSWATLLPYVAVLMVSWCLWFWLLQRLSLGAFTMRMMATCTATLLTGLLSFGFRQWRMDAAFVISCIAVAVAVRASPGEEQPVSLGLRIS